MKRVVLAVIGSLMAVSTALPAPAADMAAAGKEAVMVPVKLTAFATGVVVGTPIAVVRKVAGNTMTTYTDISGKGNKMLMVPVAALSAPTVGLFTGSIEGMYWGVANSWRSSSEHPFGKDSFSLGDMSDK